MEKELHEIRIHAMNEDDFRDCINGLYNKLYKAYADYAEELENKGVYDGNAHQTVQKMTLEAIARFLRYIEPNIYGPFHKKFAVEMHAEFQKILDSFR